MIFDHFPYLRKGLIIEYINILYKIVTLPKSSGKKEIETTTLRKSAIIVIKLLNHMKI